MVACVCPEAASHLHGARIYGSFGIYVDFLRALKGGIYFHPIDEDLSTGTPEIKMPLCCVLSVYTNSETATERKRFRMHCASCERCNIFSTMRNVE
jgi:hypothetical protein